MYLWIHSFSFQHGLFQGLFCCFKICDLESQHSVVVRHTGSHFQEMMWWHYLLQLWLCLYFCLNFYQKPGPSTIVLFYLLWFLIVCSSLRRPGHAMFRAHKNNYHTDWLFCALSVALFFHEVCTSYKSFQTLLFLIAKWSLCNICFQSSQRSMSGPHYICLLWNALICCCLSHVRWPTWQRGT